AVSFFLALLTKESALFIVVFAILCGLYTIKTSKISGIKMKWASACIVLAAVIALYLLMRTNAIKTFYTPQFNVAAHMGAMARILTAAKAFLLYLSVLLLPIGLHFERTVPAAGSLFDPYVLMAICAAGCLIYAAMISSKRKEPEFYGLLWFFAMFIPVSNFVIPLNSFAAENWIQMPAIGIFLAASAYAVRLYEERRADPLLNIVGKLPLVLLVAALIFYSFLTIKRNEEYKDPILFYESALKYEPDSVKLLNNLGLEYEIRKDAVKAEALYKKVLNIKPDHVATLNNLANAYSARGQYDDAIGLYSKALSVSPENKMFINNLGVAYVRKGDKQNAVRCWKRSLELDPDQPQIKEYIKWNQ
ncbi:MAG: tetratricopeptide repeat protein, partial [Candidatus Omnitrophota bacterium]